MAGLEAGGPPGTEMTGISFRDQLWLNSFPLERGLVFDYFALSPFYDRACNNEQLRMRSIHPLDLSHLSKMTGTEYMLYEVQEPNLFVFRKQKRDSPEKVTYISGYYVLDGSIYQAPNLHNVIGSRVLPPAPPQPPPMPAVGSDNMTVISANDGLQTQAVPPTGAVDTSTHGKQVQKAPPADQPSAKRVKLERQ